MTKKLVFPGNEAQIGRRMRWATGLLNLCLWLSVFCAVLATHAADPYISGKASFSVASGSAITIGGFTLGDTDNPASLLVEVSSTSGTLNLVTTTGITGTTVGTSLSFSGSITALGTAINSMTYQRDPTFNNASDNLTLRISDDSGTTWYPYTVNVIGKFYYPLNGHYYEFVAANAITWDAANTAASARTLYGLNGYLATITSASENAFIYPKLGGDGWIGASDAASEGVWTWVTGPEAGTQFWSDLTTAGNSSESFQGSTVGGNYANWEPGEPNNSYPGQGEDHAHMFSSSGRWNDYYKNYTSAISGYVVEYGGAGFGTLSAAQLVVNVGVVNTAPVASNGASTTAEDTSKEITLSATDADNNALAYSIVSGPSNGTLGAISGNKVTYTPAANYNGSDSFTFRANDGTANSNTGTVTVSVSAVNDAPTVSAVSAISLADTAVSDTFSAQSGTLVGADVDTGTTLTYGITGGTVSGTTSTLVGTYGSLVVNTATGAYTYTPNATAINALSANASETFTFTVSDGTATTNTSLATSFTAVNDTPAFSLAKDVREDNVATFTTAEFTAGFVDAENNALGSVTIKSLPVNGVLSLDSTPVTLNQVIVAADLANLKYTPVADDFGAKPFKVVATEAGVGGLSAPEATINFNVLSVNDAPSASLVVVTNLAGITWYAQSGSGSGFWQAIAASSNGDKLVAGVDGGNLYTSTDAGVTWTARDQARNWQSVASSADGSKLVAAVEVGNIYTSTDSGATWTARDSVRRWQSVASSADGVNLVAVEYNGKIYSSVDSGVVWTARDSTRTWSAVASSSSGSNLVAVVNGGAIYTSTNVGTNWVQRSSENRFWAAVASSSNGQKLVAAEVNGLIYTSANGGTNWTAQAGSGARFWTSLASSADGSELIASAYGGKLYTSSDSGVTWVARDSDRKWFAVAASADGSDLYAAVDGGLVYSSMDELVAFSFTVAEDSGSFTNLNYFTARSVGATNESSQAISYVLSNNNIALFSTQPAIAANGTLTFTPATNANGTATVTIVVRDDGGTANGGVDNASATPLSQFKIVVTPVDDAPTQGAVVVAGTEDTTLSFTSANFTNAYSHVDGLANKPVVSYAIESLPVSGTLKLSGAPVAVRQVIPVANLGSLTYEPALNINGALTFRVSVSDGGMSSPTGTNGALVTINLAPVNDAPFAVAQSVTTLEDTAVVINLSGVDADGNIPTATLVANGTNGFYNVNTSTYSPNANFSGVDTLTFRVSDGVLNSTVESVNIVVNAVNDAPVLGAVAVAGTEDTLVSFNTALFTTQYSDLENHPFTSLTVATLPATGSLRLAGAAVTAGQVIPVAELGGLSYMPALNETGAKIFTVRASDGSALSVPTTVAVVLGGVNDAPALAPVRKSLNEDATLTFSMGDFSTQFTDPENSGLSSLKILSLPTAGTLKNSGTNVVADLVVNAGQIGQLTYARAANENGDATFTVSSSDGDLSSEAAVVTLTVVPVNDAPSATIPTETLVPVGDTLLNPVAGNPALANWKSVASSADASKLAAVVDNGQIYVSSDSGTTWTAREGVRNWSSVASSTNGQVLAASVFRGKIYVSTNAGATWDARDSDRTWRSVSISTNGAVMAAVANGGQVYVSQDSGTNWTARATSQLWTSVAVSADGSKMLASVYGGTLYTSVDKGTNWTSVASPRLWTSVAATPDGVKLAATEVQGSIWMSADGGATWAANTAAGTNRNWSTVAMSADGSRLLAGVTGGKLYRSLDGGVSWKELAGSNSNWSAIAGSLDLKKAVVAVDGGSVSLTGDYNIPLTITVGEDSGTYTQAGFATGASAGPSNESSQTLSYTVALSGVTFTGGTNLFVGVPTVDASGALSFVPAPNAVGRATLTVSVKDNGGVTNVLNTVTGIDTTVVGSFTVEVTPVDDAPSATAQSVGVVEDTANNPITLAGSDVESQALTFQLVTQPTKGTLGGTAPTLTYTPTLNLTGADSFTFRVVAGGLTSSVSTVSIVITNVNDVPVATAQPVTTDEDTAKAITLAGSDADGNSLTYTVVTQPTKGALSGTAPALTYTPTNNYNGPDSFTFKVNDGTVDSAVATVSITVNSVNDIPVATNAVVGALEDAGAVTVTLTGSTPEPGKTLIYTVLTLPTKGTLGGAAPNLTYTPAANQSGTDSFTFKVNDGLDNSSVATVTLNITNVNDIPSFTIPTTVKPGGENAIWTKLSAANASWNGLVISTNGNVVVAASATGLTISTDGGTTVTNATGIPGSGSYNAVAVSANGSRLLLARGNQLYTYSGGTWAASSSPALNWASVASSAGGTNLVAVASGDKVHVSTNSGTTWSAVGAARDWEAVASSADGTKLAGAVYNGLIYTTTDGGTNWTARGSVNRYWTSIASSADGSKLAATEVNGQIYTSDDGGATWTARESARAWSSIAMSADGKLLLAGVLGGKLYYSDDSGVSWSAKDEVRVWGSVAIAGDGGNAVAAVLDGGLYRAAGYVSEYTVSVVEDTATTVAGFATEISAGPASESSQVVSFVLSSNNTNLFSAGPAISTAGTLSFTPAADAVGTALVEVYAQDNGGTNFAGVDRSAVKRFKITVSGVNDAPVAGSQAVTTAEDTAKAITLTGFDAEGSALTYTVVRQPSQGTLSGTAPNLVYTPSTNANGADNFTFKVSDGTLESATATVTIVVAAANDLPVVSNQSVTTIEDEPVAILLTGSDADGDALTYTVVAGPTKGELTGTAPNLVYVPNSDVSGSDSFTYKVNDGTADSSLATVTITVNAVNDAPVAGALAVTTDEDTTAIITLQGFDSEGATLTYTVVRQPVNGSLSGEGANLEYVPNGDFNGSDSFTYKVSDGSLESGAVTVAITVKSVADGPVALTQTVKVVQGNSAAVTLTGYDGDKNPLTYTVASQPKQGTLSGTAPNLVYVANTNATGTDSFTFRVNDGTSDSGLATVQIVIGEASRLSIKSSDGATLTLEVRAPRGAVVQIESGSKLGTWSATAIKVTGEGTDVGVPVNLQVDRNVPVRFWRLNVLSAP
jgi:large repetitive protein